MEHIVYTCCTQLKHGTIVRVLTSATTPTLTSLSTKGRVDVYDVRDLTLRGSFTLQLHETGPESTRKKQSEGWIMDAVFLENCGILVVASCERSLHFFTTAVTPFTERFRIYGMKDIPTSLASSASVAGAVDPSPCLVIGDDGGDVFVLHFLRHSLGLFKKTEVDDVQRIFWRELHQQAGMVKMCVLPGCHNSPVLQVEIQGSVQRVASCSRTVRSSMAVRHVRDKIAPIFFNCRYGIMCFDYDADKGLVATGSTDAKIRLWSSTDRAKAWLTLSGHILTLAAVRLYSQCSRLWSLCEQQELFNWDLDQAVCIQRIQLNFPSVLANRRVMRREFGKQPLVLIPSEGVLYVPCGNHMATIRLDGDGAESAAPNAARSGERPPAASAPGDSLVAAVERKIPFQFREGLLDAGHFEEDQHFERFIGDLQTRFARSVDASNLLADFQSRTTETESRGSEPERPVYDWEPNEEAIVLAPTHLMPMNRIKLRELDRRKPMEKHVRAGTPFCGLQLLEPIAVQLRSGLPVTTRMRKHGVFSIDNLEQVRSLNVNMFSDGLLSSLSSARSSLASSVLSYYRQKQVSDRMLAAGVKSCVQLQVTSSHQSSRKSSVDLATPRTENSDRSNMS